MSKRSTAEANTTEQEHVGENVAIDPNQLFSYFSPELFFNSPIKSNEQWYVVARQTVPADYNAFWQTIEKWTVDPQLIIPPVLEAKVLSRKQFQGQQASTDQRETIHRTLLPKRKAKDAPFDEIIEYYERDSHDQGYEARVVYRPAVNIEDSEDFVQQLPFYYPKVRAYSFVYSSEQGDHCKDEAQGVLRLELVPTSIDHVAVTDPKMQYALRTLLHKLFKWCIQQRLGYKKRAQHDILVPKDRYVEMYQRIKAKYAQDLVTNWTEKTDPRKFVFEDIAIASYLMCLWESEPRKPRFVDLGCGNGLLTYLLSSEGYPGYGVDIAERKIWAKLRGEKHDLLRVETLQPASTTYPDADWLIGNHADELVPWIPYIANKSGEHCRFLVIPCCFYALDGTRTLALRSSEDGGKYKAYTHYVKDIARKCGFECEEDYLRIPSTKNIAIVGRRRTEASLELESIELAGKAFVPRLNDRKKDQQRRMLKKAKLEAKTHQPQSS